jgi:hypothetical protein
MLCRATSISGYLFFAHSLGWPTDRLATRLARILVGVVAALLYVGLALGRPEPLAYLVAHVLKILGGAASGRVAERRRRATSTATVDFR